MIPDFRGMSRGFVASERQRLLTESVAQLPLTVGRKREGSIDVAGKFGRDNSCRLWTEFCQKVGCLAAGVIVGKGQVIFCQIDGGGKK